MTSPEDDALLTVVSEAWSLPDHVSDAIEAEPGLSEAPAFEFGEPSQTLRVSENTPPISSGGPPGGPS